MDLKKKFCMWFLTSYLGSSKGPSIKKIGSSILKKLLTDFGEVVFDQFPVSWIIS